ncbi:hypothetical protein [Amorphus orientalis]|uniref:Uncharacterized protein n=1 Tax=Amorphus orientalis TaxID=649198 RepID=A0AAE4AUS8_9HYPH|nr:hypothetical protein [Amorphus orientalis]MDQ0317773.1 hypothetical protein [Amorphus orientalis]
MTHLTKSAARALLSDLNEVKRHSELQALKSAGVRVVRMSDIK